NCGENYVDINGTQMVNKNTMSTGWLFPTAGQLDNAMTNLGVRFAATNAVQDPTHATLATNSGLTCVNGVGNGCNYQLYVTSGSEASPRQDMYYLTLNPDPKLNVWHQVTMPHYPHGVGVAGGLVYDSDHDVLFQIGPGGTPHIYWRYCSTLFGSTPG